MSLISCLIIDDEVQLAKSLSFTLENAQISCFEAYDGLSGIVAAKEKCPDIILLDVRLPDISGLDVLRSLKDIADTPVIMISAYGDTADAVQAIKMGAEDYLTKPFDLDELILLVRKTIAARQMKNEVKYLRGKTVAQNTVVGASQAMQQLAAMIDSVATSKAKTILLLGETGVGKTLVAKEIHNKSGNADSPFVEINCSLLPEHLIDAELFGVEKGAFTGANSTRPGLVEIANNGTLFLDEIGELPLSLQSKLLTLLESWVYRSLGSSRERKANIRVIAATNRQLEERVENGEFRKDLYFRLNVIPIEIPPLRHREGDILLLVKHFAEWLAHREGSESLQLSDDISAIFTAYPWPGNVRELKNIIERLTILHPGESIKPSWLPGDLLGAGCKETPTIKDTMADAERDLVRRTLNECGGKKGLTAEKLGISRHALKRRIQKLGLE